MQTLPNNWFFNGNLDFEYKKYVLLAYLQYVNRHFQDTKLYPVLGELVTHHRNLFHYLENKNKMDMGFPKLMEGIDLRKFKVIYKQVAGNDDTLETIERLVQFALPAIKSYLETGKEIYEFIEENLEMFPVGILPLHKDEGYLILSKEKAGHLVYSYSTSIFNGTHDKYRSIHTTFLKSYKRSITNTFPQIKYDLIKSYKHMPNPATYVVKADINVPIKETLLPIAKKMLMAHLAVNS